MCLDRSDRLFGHPQFTGQAAGEPHFDVDVFNGEGVKVGSIPGVSGRYVFNEEEREMLFDHPELEARLQQVLGCDTLNDLSVLNMKLHYRSATLELKMAFVEGSIPPNFQNKSKNCLIFFVHMPDFKLQVTYLPDGDPADQIENLSSKNCTFRLGKHRYRLDAEKVHFDTFQSVNEMDLVDQEW
ncbi:hypothetical protein [Coralliovum pocilloporae]|uniref:hypothetical protein n=1 Tax=Coralliovum pocilloporae TaxID=3066369 RepID=UPI0033075C25